MSEIIKEGEVSEGLLNEADPIEVGQWYWYKAKKKEEPSLACVVHVGSNYVELKFVEHYSSSLRIHLDEFDQVATRELDPDSHIQAHIQECQKEVNSLMDEVRELTARLGVAPSAELTAGGETAALAKVNGTENFSSYTDALIKAKKKDLPELFQAIEQATSEMALWMGATVIPLQAQAERMKESIERIEDRIFSVELYSGLVEKVALVADGTPAPLDTKVHLFQRRHYMDEECLARYTVGGMEFKDIPEFDAWLRQPENFERLLPQPRCVVAFQVRRNKKHRTFRDIAAYLRILEDEKFDKLTFLYIRNGQQLFRMGTKFDFGAKLFPDMKNQAYSGGKLWAKTFTSTVDRIITDEEYQGLVEEYDQEMAKWKAESRAYKAALKTPEAKAKAKKKGLKYPDASCVDVPWPGSCGPIHDPRDRWEPYNKESVYYDDIFKHIQGEIKEHNRVALILQGLLDRSPVFHPHPPWQLWTPEGFSSALELVYDEDRALAAGDAPDFEAYRARLNESLQAGSVTVGQERAWLRREADKENERRDRHPRYNEFNGYRELETYRPYGNPGPGVLAKVVTCGKKLTYAWSRKRRDYMSDDDSPLRATFSCEPGKVLNVDAYKPGDFRQFFDDPRTRKQYLKWAPLLLEAEEYHAGNREVLDPPPPAAKKSTYAGRLRYARQKRAKELMDQVVRLVRPITTKGGAKYPAGSFWKVVLHSRGEFTLDGLGEYLDCRLRLMSESDFELGLDAYLAQINGE